MESIELRDIEVRRIGKSLSFNTLTKIGIRIRRIRMYYGNFRKIKSRLAENEHDLIYQVYFIAIAVLYRSIFKKLDKGFQINVENLGIINDEKVYANHNLLISIVDKDFAHLDKDSKTHRVLDVQAHENGTLTRLSTASISEDKLKKTIDFLSLTVEPAIREATSIADV